MRAAMSTGIAVSVPYFFVVENSIDCVEIGRVDEITHKNEYHSEY